MRCVEFQIAVMQAAWLTPSHQTLVRTHKCSLAEGDRDSLVVGTLDRMKQTGRIFSLR